MTANAVCISEPCKSKLPIIPILCILVFATAVQLTFHAILTHKSETEAVDQACGRHSLGVWENPTNGKQFQLCKLPDGSYGIRVMIRDANNNLRKITSFIRKVHSKPVLDIVKIMEYINKANGATEFLGIVP